MKYKSTSIILTCISVCFLLFNIYLLLIIQINKHELANTKLHLENVEFMFEVSKEITITRFKYEQCSISDSYIYAGSNNSEFIPINNITNQPKLVLGLNQNMCKPCVEGVFDNVKEIFPNFELNPNIICIADIEQRFKDDYYGIKVISFHNKNDFPLYEIETRPYFFIIDKDLCIKQLFITDITSPELTKEYLRTLKEHYEI